MANTTFTGPVRSENGFQVVSKNATSGATSTSFTLNASGVQVSPVLLTDADVTLSGVVHGGRVIVVPAVAANRTVTLPDPSAGLYFKLIYGGAAEETENLIIDTGSDTNFFIGGLQHLDTNADNVSVYADGNSNSILTLTDFGIMEINILAKDDTNWYVWGNIVSATAPAFTDQP
jgi:hypothetical protein